VRGREGERARGTCVTICASISKGSVESGMWSRWTPTRRKAHVMTISSEAMSRSCMVSMGIAIVSIGVVGIWWAW
jgi:hypothetical protein